MKFFICFHNCQTKYVKIFMSTFVFTSQAYEEKKSKLLCPCSVFPSQYLEFQFVLHVSFICMYIAKFLAALKTYFLYIPIKNNNNVVFYYFWINITKTQQEATQICALLACTNFFRCFRSSIPNMEKMNKKYLIKTKK